MEEDRKEIDVNASNEFYRKLLSENEKEQDEAINVILAGEPVALAEKDNGMFPVHVLALMGSVKNIRRWLFLGLSIEHAGDKGGKFFECLIRNLTSRKITQNSGLQNNSYEDMLLLVQEIIFKYRHLLNQHVKKNTVIPHLHDFINRGYFDLAHVFIDQGANLDWHDNRKNNIFHLLVNYYDKNILDHVLRKMPDKRLLFETNKEGLRPIHVAARRSNIPALLGFYKAGEDLLSETTDGETIFHMMIKNGDYGMFKNVFNQLKDDALLDEKFNFEQYLAFIDLQAQQQPKRQGNFDIIKIFLENQKKVAEDTMQHRTQKIQNISFCGGGMKGAGFIAVIEALVGHKCAAGIQEVSGTSAGAIFGALFCAGYRDREELITLNCENMILDFFKKENPNYATLLTQLLEPGKVKTILKNVFSGRLISGLKGLNNEQGLFSGDEFRESIDKMLCKKIDSLIGRKFKDLTLGELHELGEEFPEFFKDLTVKTVNIDKHRVEDISYRTHPTVTVASAVRASGGYPIIFKPCQLLEKRGDGKIYTYSDERYIDGGVLENNPIEAFDKVGQGKYQTTVTNEGTVGFRLVATEEFYGNKQKKSVKADNGSNSLWSFIKDFAQCYAECESNKNDKPDNLRRTVEVPVSFSTWDVDYTPDEMRKLINENVDLASKNVNARLEEIQATAFLKRIPKEFIAAMAKYSSQAYLTEKDVKDLLLSKDSNIRVVQYCPEVVYSLYKNFDEKDINFLRKRLTIDGRAYKDAIQLSLQNGDKETAIKIATSIGEKLQMLHLIYGSNKMLMFKPFEHRVREEVSVLRSQNRDGLTQSR